jgi:hypothetical protein
MISGSERQTGLESLVAHVTLSSLLIFGLVTSTRDLSELPAEARTTVLADARLR